MGRRVVNLYSKLNAIRPKLAQAAQKVIDEWTQDDEGVDEEFGSGGACDAVANTMSEVISNNIHDVNITDGGQDGDDHAYLIVYNDDEAYEVDIPPGIYERSCIGRFTLSILESALSPALYTSRL